MSHHSVNIALGPSVPPTGGSMPIGIPAPPFGLEEVAPPNPNPWTSEVAGKYYVDYQTGTDTGRTYGYPAAPRKTIPNTIPAGSVVTLATGSDYRKSHNSPNFLRGQGTVDQPVFIRGESAAAKPQMFVGQGFDACSYTIFENIHFHVDTGAYLYGIVWKNGANHTVVRHCEYTGANSIGDGAFQMAVSNGYNVCWDVVVHSNGNMLSPDDQDSHAFHLTGSYNWLLDCVATQVSGDGVQIGGLAGSANHQYVGRCEFYQCRQTGFWVKTAVDVVISECVAWGHVPYYADNLPGYINDGDGYGYQYDCQNVWFLCNRSYDNKQGLRQASWNAGGRQNIYILGNIFHDNSANGVMLTGNTVAADHFIAGNTFYNNAGAHIRNGSGQSVPTVSNNIFAGTRSYDLNFTVGTAGTTVRNNLFPAAGALINWNGPVYNLAQFQGATGKGQDCLEGSPDFTDPNNPTLSQRDFAILSTSDAINAGAVESPYQTFETNYDDISIAKDFLGRDRPVGGAWDMGAYEYQTAIDMPIGIPTPPFGLTETAPVPPSPWTTEIPGKYYINYTTGVDTGRTYGYPGAPRKTIPLALPAGSVVVLAAGVSYHKDHALTSDIVASGTSAEPIWIIGESGTRPVMTKSWAITGSYFFIEGLDWDITTNYNQILNVSSGTTNHVAIRDCNFDGNGLGTDGVTFNGLDYFVLSNCTIHDGGTFADYTVDQDKCGINVEGTASYGWILDTEISYMAGTGVQLNSTTANHIYVGRCHTHHCHQGGIFAKYCTDVVFSQNVSHDHVSRPDPSGSQSKCFGTQYGAQRLWVIFNEGYNCTAGMFVGGDSAPPPNAECYLIGNKFWNIANDASFAGTGIRIAGGNIWHVVGNSLYNCVRNFGMLTSGIADVYLNNNVFGTPTGGTNLNITGDTTAMTIDHNLFQSGSIVWGGTTYPDLAAFLAAVPGGATSCIVADPLFVSPPTNMGLQPGSQAVNAGVLDGVYATYQSLDYGSDIAKDATGVARPQNLVWDMGAYEYQG